VASSFSVGKQRKQISGDEAYATKFTKLFFGIK
jgi:hypothetical protein